MMMTIHYHHHHQKQVNSNSDDFKLNSIVSFSFFEVENDCIVLSSEDEDETQEFSSVLRTNFDDASYWQDVARFTYDLFEEYENLQRKRTHSMNSSLISADDRQHKRTKSDNVDVITLSSSDDDNDLA